MPLQFLHRFALAALIGVAVLPVAGQTQSDPVAVFKQAVDARNRGDITSMLALFAPDAVRQDGSCPQTCTGQAMRQSFDQNVSEHFQASILSAQPAGNVINARAELRSDTFRSRGAERVISNFVVEVRDGKITRWTSTLDATDPQTAAYQAALRANPIN